MYVQLVWFVAYLKLQLAPEIVLALSRGHLAGLEWSWRLSVGTGPTRHFEMIVCVSENQESNSPKGSSHTM